MKTRTPRWILSAVLLGLALACGPAPAETPPSGASCAWYQDTAAQVARELLARHGDGQRARLERGLAQVGLFWRAEDGDATQFAAFARANFAGDQPMLDALFTRFEHQFEMIDGHLNELAYEFRLQTDLERGPILPIDEILAGYALGAHLNDDFFGNKLAFIVLLNFPLYTLDQILAESATWSRRQWAEVRLAQRFAKRIPAAVQQSLSAAVSDAEIYISEYKVCMHHVLDAQGARPFPARLRLTSHWGLRDELKGQYSNPAGGLARQRLIQRILERVIDQSIPQAVINNPRVDWEPIGNTVQASPVRDLDPAAPAGKEPPVSNAAEPDVRYAKWLAVFQACRKMDPYSPTAPTLIARRFDEDRQMSEERVRGMLVQLLTAPEFAATARLIEKRLGRPLEPFDIWYNGFRPRATHTEAQLDALVRQRYPTAAAFHDGLPRILTRLGFSRSRAEFLQAHIDVEPARGNGHAIGGQMRGQKARLRTRVETDGMTYQGFNVAMHELGHNIEQTFSLNLVDHTLLQGVPNTAFTEGLAMLLQGHDLELLGLARPDAQSAACQTLSDFWVTCEIAAMALTDMAAWHWLYEHPAATPAEFKAAVIGSARALWNTYYAPIFPQRDMTLLAVYSHMVQNVLYLPDYPIGHLIAFQVEEQMKKAGRIGPEFERITKLGNVAPDLWMQHATGAPVGADAMLHAARRALTELQAGDK